MALSQVQCLDDNHINVRTNESKPDFFYSEEQRLALERLIHAGRDAFEDYIKTKNLRCFLSDLELERILNTVEVYSPGSCDNPAELHGESDGDAFSLQYWPERSDYSIPQLDIGWPDTASYRGVTRVHVYTQPPYEGQSHIKEVVRKMIGQAQKVVAIVMDLFTDIDIFKDVLDASYRRKVAVYIILESTGVNHFLRMCDKAGMHTGHLKNLRVRSIRGAEFFSRSSKKVCGSQSQKFMFIDGDKAVSGSYSFTWSASRLDRNLITVLTGHTVDIFDRLFQDMYLISNGVCLSAINLGSEPERLPQAVSAVFPTANTALKLINPKYSLVSNCTFTSNGPAPDQTGAKNTNQKEVFKQIRDAPVLPALHPGLLDLEKANMIDYVPTWPDPEPARDVIGFINIRDTNKPLQAHLMRSELFEVSQAIRFKDTLCKPREPLSVRACSISQTASAHEDPAQTCTEAQRSSGETQKHAEYFDQNQQQESSHTKDLNLPLQSPQPETMHVLTGHIVDKGAPDVMKKEQDSLQNQNICTDKDLPDSTSCFVKDNTYTKKTMNVSQILQCPIQTPNNLDFKSTSAGSDSLDNPVSVSVESFGDKVLTDGAIQGHGDTKPVLVLDETQQNCYDRQISKSDSNISSLSDYYDCISPVADLRFESEAFVLEKTSDVQSYNQIKNIHEEQECSCLNSYTIYNSEENKQTWFTPESLKTSFSNVYNSVSYTNPSATSTTQPFTADTVQESLHDKEEYYECSDTVGFEFDSMVNSMEPSSEEMTTQEADTEHCNIESTCQNMKKIYERKVQSGSEKQSGVEVIFDNEDDAQPQLDENIKRQPIQESRVTLRSAVESELICNFWSERRPEKILQIQPKKLNTENQPKLDSKTESSLDLICKEQSIEKTDKPPKLDSETESSLDLICEKQSVELAETTENPPILDSEIESSLDLICEEQSIKKTEKPPKLVSEIESSLDLIYEEQSIEKTYKPPKLDSEPKLSLDLICKEQSGQLAEKTEKPPKLDSEPKLSLDLICKEQSGQLAEKTEKTPKLDSELESSLDLIYEEQSIEKTNKPPKLDSEPKLSLDLICKEQSRQLAEKTEKIPKLDFELESSLDLICEKPSVKLTETIEKPPILDSEIESSLDLICEKPIVQKPSVQLTETTEKPPKLDFEIASSLDLICKEQSGQLADKAEKPPKLDSELESILDLICEEQSIEKTNEPPKLDSELESSLDLICEEQSIEKTNEPPKLDSELESSLDLICEEQSIEKTNEPPKLDSELESSLDLIYEEQSIEKTNKPPKLDSEPKLSLDLICKEQSRQLAEKTEKIPKLDFELESSLDLICEKPSVKLTETIEKPPILDSEIESSLDLICEKPIVQKPSVQLTETTEKPPKLDFEIESSLDLICKEQSGQLADKAEKPPKLDSELESILDLICEEQSIEKTNEPPKLDSELESSLDLICEEQSIEKTNEPPKLDSELESSLDLICEEQSIEKTNEPPKLDSELESSLDLIYEEQSIEKTNKPPKLDSEPKLSLDLICKEQSRQLAEKTEKIPKLDFELESSLDLICEKPSVKLTETIEKPPILDSEIESSLDLICEKPIVQKPSVQLTETTEKPPKLDFEIESSLDLICKEQSGQLADKAEKTPKLDSELESILDLICEEQSIEKTNEPPKLDSELESSLDLICEEQSIEKTNEPPKLDSELESSLDLIYEEQSIEKTNKPPKLDSEPKLSLDLICKEQSRQLAEKTEKIPKLDFELESSLDLICEKPSVKLTETIEKPPILDSEIESSLDLICEKPIVQKPSVQLTETTEKPPKLDFEIESSLDLICKEQSGQLADKAEKPPKLDSELESILDLICEEQSIEKTDKPQKLDSEPKLSLDLICKEQSGQLAEKTDKPPKLDSELESSLDLICEEQSIEKTNEPPKLDSELESSLDLIYEEQSIEKTYKPPKLDSEPKLSLDLICKEQSGQLAEKTEKPPKLDSEPKLSLDLICKEQSGQLAEKTEKTPKLDSELESSLDLIYEEQSIEKTNKPPKLDSEPKLSLDLICKEQSGQLADKTDKPPKLDSELESSLDLICEEQSIEKTNEPPKLDSELESSLDLICEEQSIEKTNEPPKLDSEIESSLDLIYEEQSIEKTYKPPKLDSEPKLSLDLICKEQSGQLAEKTEKTPKLDSELESSLDLIYEEQSIEKTNKPPKLDSEPKLSLDLICKEQSGQLADKTDKPPKLDSEPKLSQDLICKEQLTENTEKPPILNSSELNLDSGLDVSLICASILKHSEVNDYKSQSAADSKSDRVSSVPDKVAVTPVIPEKASVTVSTGLHKTDELQNLLADLDFANSNLESAAHVNELKLQDDQTVLKKNSEKHSAILPEDFETVKLLILEDSDLQDIEEKNPNRSEPRRTKAAVSTENKPCKAAPARLRIVNVRKPIEDHYSKRGKQTCHLTSQVKEKQEGERVSTAQVIKSLPGAKPKLDCQQPHQASKIIPNAKEARGESSTLPITKPHSVYRSQRPPTGTHRYSPGPPLHNPCVIASSCPENLATGEAVAFGSMQLDQGHPWKVRSSNCPTSSPQQPHVKLNGPKTRQSEPVLRKHPASTIIYSSPSGMPNPRQTKNLKQTFKETHMSKKKKE
nr:uncharacterized protein fam83ga isoform X2 [Misgurnus anguillicaudatus]